MLFFFNFFRLRSLASHSRTKPLAFQFELARTALANGITFYACRRSLFHQLTYESYMTTLIKHNSQIALSFTRLISPHDVSLAEDALCHSSRPYFLETNGILHRLERTVDWKWMQTVVGIGCPGVAQSAFLKMVCLNWTPVRSKRASALADLKQGLKMFVSCTMLNERVVRPVKCRTSPQNPNNRNNRIFSHKTK